MKNSQRRVTLTLGAVAGGLLATAFLPMAIANADTTDYIYTPDTSTFDPMSAQGYPPLVDVLQGTESWSLANPPSDVEIGLDGVDTQTTFGSFTNNDFLVTGGSITTTVPDGGTAPILPTDLPCVGAEIDLANFGAGFENEWIDLPGVDGAAATITDTVFTPFGDFTL
jgi:hypothetical protein